MNFSKRIKGCELSPIRKFYPYTQAAIRNGKKIYYLNIGQPDIKTPPAFFDAVHRFNEPVLEYAPSPGIPELLAQIKAYYARIGVHYETSEILITSGGSEALQFALLALLDPGDEVLVPEPFYSNYETFTQMAGGSIRPVPTSPEDGFHYADRALIESCLTPAVRGLILTNPGNPTGTVLTRSEMRMIADLVIEHDLFLIADEVYREFIYNNAAVSSFAEFADLAEQLILIDSVSKRFSACGARIGALMTKNFELYQHVLKLCQSRLSSPTIDQLGAVALYKIDPEYFTDIREEYRHRRDVIFNHLIKMEGVVCARPEGAFYITVRLPVDDADRFQLFLLTDFDSQIDYSERPRETILFSPAEGFYATPGKGRQEVRLAYVLKAEDLTRAMELLSAGLRQYNSAISR